MKKIVLLVALAASVACDCAWAASSAEENADRISSISLWQICRAIEPPTEGAIYENDANVLMVLQVIPNGVLAGLRQGVLDTAQTRDIIFVRTTRSYADGDALAEGYYRSVGRMSYEAVNGARKTVYAFSEIPDKERKAIAAVRQDRAAMGVARREAAEERQRRAEQSEEFQKSKERIAAEEDAAKERLAREKQERENAAEIAKLNAEKENRLANMRAAAKEEEIRQKAEDARELARLAREREAQDKENRKRIAAAKAEQRQSEAKLAVEVQKERERYAADALSAIDFNFKHHVVIQRSIRKNVRVEIIDPKWSELAELQAKQDWLALLGAIDGSEYDEFPSEAEMKVILASLKEMTFRISVKGMRPPAFICVFAKNMEGNSCVYGGGVGRWGRLPMSCMDLRYGPQKGTPIEKIKGAEVVVAPFANKVYVINGDTQSKTERALGITFTSNFDGDADKLDKLEEWLKLN